MKPCVDRRGWLLGGALAALAVSALWSLSSDDWPIRNLRLPLQLYPSGKEKVQIHAGMARAPQDGDIEARTARIELLTETGVVEGWAEADECRYSRAASRLTSDGPVRMRRGGVFVTGRGLDLNMAEEVMRILNDVRVELGPAAANQPPSEKASGGRGCAEPSPNEHA